MEQLSAEDRRELAELAEVYARRKLPPQTDPGSQ
jgi:hypothetical protein